jgi:hypothetical protein
MRQPSRALRATQHLALGEKPGRFAPRNGELQADQPVLQPIFDHLQVEVAAQQQFLHHDGVGALRFALVLGEEEQFLRHEHQHVEFVFVAVQVDQNALFQNEIGDLRVAVPLWAVRELYPEHFTQVVFALFVRVESFAMESSEHILQTSEIITVK